MPQRVDAIPTSQADAQAMLAPSFGSDYGDTLTVRI